ncbi:MAG: glycosyltransferase family 4 protein [Polyangiaceae bacterium]
MAIAVQGRGSPPVVRDPTGCSAPRGYLFDELFEKKYDESILDFSPMPAGSRALPDWARLAAEVQRRQDEYDVIVTWSERVTLSLMTLQRFSSPRKPHVAMLYWFSRPSVRFPMMAFGRSLHAIVTWSSVQREYAIKHLSIPPGHLYLVKHYADHVFWSPRVRDEDMICSVGAEMRDYGTLLDALRGTGLRCHIAADHVRVDHLGFARRISTDTFAAGVDENITIGRKPLRDLRELYARSRFVVVPLRPSDTDNGITVILEAMSMGKPVICSRTRGQVDVIQEGITGIFVPVGDADALRTAMRELWNDPARAREMGQAARAYVERHHTLEKFCRDVKGAVDASLEGRGAERDGSFAVPLASDPAAHG